MKWGGKLFETHQGQLSGRGESANGGVAVEKSSLYRKNTRSEQRTQMKWRKMKFFRVASATLSPRQSKQKLSKLQFIAHAAKGKGIGRKGRTALNRK